MKNLRLKFILTIITVIIAFCMCLPLGACVFEFPIKSSPYTKIDKVDDFLMVEEGLVKNGYGEEVLLRGVNAGGLLVTEHWMTGFVYLDENSEQSKLEDGTQLKNDNLSLNRIFIQRFGEERTKRLWQEYRENWWNKDDFKNCAKMGINVIRLPFTYMNVDFGAVSDYSRAGNYDFSILDDFVEQAAEYGIYTILDLHGAYGSQSGQDHSGQIIDDVIDVDFYRNEQMQTLTVNLWKALSEHFKDNVAVAGYDILNEPGEKAGTTSERHWEFFDKVYNAIRSTGDEHIVIFESCWDGANLPKPAVYGWENCMYSFHHYAGDKLSQEEYRASWDNKLLEVESRNFNVPLQMGEFTNYTSAENWEYVLELLDKNNWHWVSWTYKVCGGSPWGIVGLTGVDKVNALNDDYDVILEKFGQLRTDGEKASKYTFTNGKTLENIFKQFLSDEE